MNFSDSHKPDKSPHLGDAARVDTPLGPVVVPKVIMCAMIGGCPPTIAAELWVILFGGEPGQLPNPLLTAIVLRMLALEGKRQADVVRAHDEGPTRRPSGPSLN